MSTIPTPNMGLPVPSVSTEPGPQYATDINSCMDVLDAHDHSAGSGVPVKPGGMLINADLPFGSNNATALRSVRWTAQSVPLALPTDIGCAYVSGVDLYFNDLNGNQIQITQAGGVAGTPGSIGSLTSPASATYVAVQEKFVWQSDANVAASLDCRSLILRNAAASSFGLTLSPPSLAADYAVTLPALPVSTAFTTIDAAGNMGSTVSTTGGITKTMQAAVGQQLSSSSGLFSTSSTTGVDVTNLTVTITTVGRPVMLSIQSEGSSSASLGLNRSTSNASAFLDIYRDATVIKSVEYALSLGGVTSIAASIPLSLVFLDVPSAGTYTYKVKARVISGTSGEAVSVRRVQLTAYEL